MSKKSKSRTKTKRPQEPIRKEIRGIIFFLIALILGVSLFSYHPGDSLFLIETGHTGKVHNLFGTAGAHLAGGIFLLFGFASFWLVAIFLAMTFLSFRGHPIPSPIKNIIAILFLIVSFSGIMKLQLPGDVSYMGEKVMSGGLMGILISGFMQRFLNYFGAYVLLSAVFIISFMICTRISFGWLYSKIATWFLSLIRK